MVKKAPIETVKNDLPLLRSTSSYLSNISHHRHSHRSKSDTKSTIVIHRKIHSSNLPSTKNKSLNHRHHHRKSKAQRKHQLQVIPYNDNICQKSFQHDESCISKIPDELSTKRQSTGEFFQITEQTKKQKKSKRCRYLFNPSSLSCLFCFIFIMLILGTVIAVLLFKFLPKSPTTITTTKTTTTSTSVSTTSVTTTTISTTTTTITSTSTTRPFGALSLYAIVTASYFNPGAGTATAQGDGLVDRQPNGPSFLSNYPPQYVQLELPNEYNITNVCLLISQTPNGFTHHQLLVGSSVNTTQLVNDFNGTTYNNQWINITYSPPLNNVRILHLKTISSPSWVSWGKFLVYGI